MDIFFKRKMMEISKIFVEKFPNNIINGNLFLNNMRLRVCIYVGVTD